MKEYTKDDYFNELSAELDANERDVHRERTYQRFENYSKLIMLFASFWIVAMMAIGLLWFGSCAMRDVLGW